MGVFREDYEIFVSQLVRLWIAEGFIQPQVYKSLERIAEDYLKDLVDRNLILVRQRNHNGGIKSCIIHDLLRELCIEKAQDDKFLRIMNLGVPMFLLGGNNPRRVSMHSDMFYCLTNVQDWTVRSLLCFCWSEYVDSLVYLAASFRLLRVFNALTIFFDNFPIEIVELVRLRYIAFACKGKIEIPTSISKLQNLQTLIVRGIIPLNRLLYLPSNIWKMQQLRHLLFKEAILPTPITGEDPMILENLQTLSVVKNFNFTRKVIEMMPNLKKLGMLYIHDTYTNTDWFSYEFNNFVCLHQLEILKCRFIRVGPCARAPLPIKFAFPPNLKKLTLRGCRISCENITIVGLLPNLEVLKLINNGFEDSVWEPNEGEFSKLKFLLINDADLEHWRANSTHFPCLQHLTFERCFKLMEIPSEIGDIATLEMLELDYCSKSAEASAKLIQEEQQTLENNLRVRTSRPFPF